jgi:hypothetical protein
MFYASLNKDDSVFEPDIGTKTRISLDKIELMFYYYIQLCRLVFRYIQVTGFHIPKEISMDKKRNASPQFRRVLHTIHLTRGFVYGALILGALLAFELFNYSTTDFALTDLLGDLRFLDMRWATILALAFCGIDFAGLARLFTPERGAGEPKEVWYLFAAWLLAATMNALLTWWGVATAILSHTSSGSSVIPPETILTVVPIFVAIMVWVIRVLIIGSLSVAGSRMFSQAEQAYQVPSASRSQPVPAPGILAPSGSLHPTPTIGPKPASTGLSHTEPTYHPASMSGSSHSRREARK